MKKVILIFVFALSFWVSSFACDICGCGVGNNYIGILPDFKQKIIGLRFRYNSMLSHIGVDGVRTYLTTDETYRTLELYGGWNIGKHFRAMATVPYSFNERENRGTTSRKNGMGDISFTVYYQLLNSRKMFRQKLLVQNLFIGAGMKLPTGKYNPADKGNTSESGNLFQLGTASVDYTITAMYDLRVQDIGINVNGSYKINGTNKYEYRYGNKLTATTQLYYKYKMKNNLSLAPNAGILYENGKTDTDNGFRVDISGGKIFCVTAGIEVAYKKAAIGFSWQKPVSQDLAHGIVKANSRTMLHLSFLL
jgi:hypothetical protein